MFKKEVELLQNLDHENILKIYSYGIGKKEKIKKTGGKIEKNIYYLVRIFRAWRIFKVYNTSTQRRE